MVVDGTGQTRIVTAVGVWRSEKIVGVPTAALFGRRA
jgi:hypothetical protein